MGTSGQQAGDRGHGKVDAGIPLPGYRVPGPTPRGAECARATASRGKVAQGTGLSERQRQVQPEGQRLRCLRHPQRGDQHAAIGWEGGRRSRHSSRETKDATGLIFLLCKLGWTPPSWKAGKIEGKKAYPLLPKALGNDTLANSPKQKNGEDTSVSLTGRMKLGDVRESPGIWPSSRVGQ